LTADREWGLPDESGTLALTSDITGTNSGTNTGDQDLSGLVPYTGATGDVDLGANDLTANKVNAACVEISTPASESGDFAFQISDSGSMVRTTINDLGAQAWTLNSGAAEAGQIVYTTPSNEVGIVFFNAAGTGRTQIKHLSSSGGFALGATTGSGNPDNHLVILPNSGKIGIGKDLPDAKLDVAGDANIDTDLTVGGKVSAASLNLSGLPTSDPLVSGDVWNDSGTLKISA